LNAKKTELKADKPSNTPREFIPAQRPASWMNQSKEGMNF
jgi:hypothetical protein